jgi:AraC-like DNA-binding protein
LGASRLAFTPLGVSAGADETKRLARWWDEHVAASAGCAITANRDRPFTFTLDYMALGPFGLGRSSSLIDRYDRRREDVARDDDDRFTLTINCGPSPTGYERRGGVVPLSPGSACLFDHTEAAAHVCPGGGGVMAFIMPRRLVCATVAHAEDLVGTVVTTDSGALRLIVRYAGALLDDPDLSDPAVLAQAGQSLLDLVALALGTERDQAESARLRGLRAARLASVLHALRADFADPEISPETVARCVGISTRYLHDLLHETGISFSERVQEFRLARALGLLTGRNGAAPRISDAAYQAGFNDLSHFNRLFRRRYGLTPTAARGRLSV